MNATETEIRKIKQKIDSSIEIHDQILYFLLGSVIAFVILGIGFTLGYYAR